MKITALPSLAFFSTHPLRFTSFAACIALFQATVLNLAFYLQIFHYITFTSLHDMLFAASMPVVIFCVIFAFLNTLIFPFLAKIISVLLLLIGAPLTYFMITFNIIVNHSMLINALGTDENEAMSLMTPMLFVYVVFLGILPAVVVCFIKINPASKMIPYLIRRALAAISSLIVVILIAFVLYKNYAAFFRNHPMIQRYLLPSNYIGALYSHYTYLKDAHLPFIAIGQDAYITSKHSHETKKTLMVLIVGETARAQNFSLNDYHKQTTPKLSKEANLINFKHTSSCGTYTAHSVPCMFSNMNRVDYDATKAAHQANVLDILKQVGIRLLWQENDGGCKGVCDRIETTDVTEKFKTHSPLCGTGTCLDEILLSGIDDHIAKLDNTDALIVLHMIGSHGPNYYHRYPKAFAVFKPRCDTNEINQCDKEALANTYDNTILYTDHFIASTIDLLKKYQNSYNVMMLYMSDHGESLGENGVYLHSMPYSFAPEEQTHIPFLVWASPSFFKQKHIDLRCIAARADTETFSHDNLFHTLLGIFNVTTKEYQKNLDIFSPCQTAD